MPDDPTDEVMFGPDVPAEHLASFQGPKTIGVGERVEYAIAGPPLNKLTVAYLPNAATGGPVGPSFEFSEGGARSGSIETEEFVAEAELGETGDRLDVTAHKAPPNSTLIVYGEPSDLGIIGPGVPSGPERIPVFGATRIVIGCDICINMDAQGVVRVSWPFSNAVLEVAADITGPWHPIIGAVSPYVVQPLGS